jgi:hypothetical protein
MRVTRWRGLLPRAAVLALVTALAPLPAFASDTAAAPAGKSTQGSLQAAAAREVANIAASRPAAVRHNEMKVRSADFRVIRGQQTSSPARGSGFLKSGPGMVAIAVLAVGTGYAIYSAKHDRISSPGRK